MKKIFCISLLLSFVFAGCMRTQTSSSGGMGGITVQNSNPSAIIAAARSVFAQSGYSMSSIDYPTAISFDKPAGRLGELMYGSYDVTTTIRVKLSLVAIPGSSDYRLTTSVSRVSDVGEAGFEESTKMLELWSQEFKPLLRQVQSQATGAGRGA